MTAHTAALVERVRQAVRRVQLVATSPWEVRRGGEVLASCATYQDAFDRFEREKVIAALTASGHAEMVTVLERVAEHFADTDAPLGIAARAAIAKGRASEPSR